MYKTHRLNAVAALDGAGRAARTRFAAAANLEGGGGRKKRESESDGSDAGEHCAK